MYTSKWKELSTVLKVCYHRVTLSKPIFCLLQGCVCVCVCVSVCVCLCVCVCASRSVVSDSATPWTVAGQAPLPMDSPGKNTGVGSHSLLQGIFLTQGLNPGLLHYRHSLLSEPPGKPQLQPSFIQTKKVIHVSAKGMICSLFG